MYFEAATGNMLMPVLTFECGAVAESSLGPAAVVGVNNCDIDIHKIYLNKSAY